MAFLFLENCLFNVSNQLYRYSLNPKVTNFHFTPNLLKTKTLLVIIFLQNPFNPTQNTFSQRFSTKFYTQIIVVYIFVCKFYMLFV